MERVEVTPYSEIPEEERTLPRTNWVVDGSNTGTNWTSVRDEKYGEFRHVRLRYPDGNTFDKVDCAWTPGVFIVVFRKNPEKGNRIEFFIPYELRPLLKDKNGIQGGTEIRNIPQGMVKVWKDQNPVDAAYNETLEETGLTPKTLILARNLKMDAANSSALSHFFLAEVPFQADQKYVQDLEPTEMIKAGDSDWFGLREIKKLELECGKTLAGIELAREVLNLDSQARRKPRRKKLLYTSTGTNNISV